MLDCFLLSQQRDRQTSDLPPSIFVLHLATKAPLNPQDLALASADLCSKVSPDDASQSRRKSDSPGITSVTDERRSSSSFPSPLDMRTCFALSKSLVYI